RLIEELYSLRMVLEPYAAKRVVEHLDEQGRARLEAALAQIAESVRANDAQALAQSDIAFHNLLYQLADHALLMRACQENIPGTLRMLLNITTGTLSALADAEQQHRRILEPMLTRDAELVQARLVGHIAEAAERARAGLAGRPVGAPGPG